jgi:quercetin dioxygenase-like cupin family protein
MRLKHPSRRQRLAITTALAIVAVTGCASANGAAPTPAASRSSPSAPAGSAPASAGPSTPAASSTVFATATPPNAPTQALTLYHVDVPAGAVIAPHQHPGQQLSHVTSGTLTYTVISGQVTVFDPPVNGKPGRSRTVAAPATIDVRAGQSLAERAGEIHRATNQSSTVVRIDIAVLVPRGDPLSIPAG